MNQSILIIGIIIYYIKEQYSFSDVKRWTFLFIPLFSLYQFLRELSLGNVNNVLGLVLIALVSCGIGFYQAKYSKVKEENRVVSYFKDNEGQEVPIYKKIVKSYGGTHYLIGWLFICLFQLGIEAFLFNQKVTLSTSFNEILDEIVKDIFSVYRIYDLKRTSWYVWALYGLSSLSYTYFLSKKSPEFKGKVFKKRVIVE